MIINAFREHPYFHPYADYVEFCFSTGARVGEAAGLLWRNVSPGRSSIWIGEQWTKGTAGDPNEFLFKNPTGGPIRRDCRVFTLSK